MGLALVWMGIYNVQGGTCHGLRDSREKIFWSGECRISPAVPGAQGLMHARFTLASEEKIFR